MQTAAAVAAQALIHGGDGRLYQTKKAPGPDNVNWSALWCSPRTRMRRRILGGLLFMVFMITPMGAFAGGLTYVRPLQVFWAAVAAAGQHLRSTTMR